MFQYYLHPVSESFRQEFPDSQLGSQFRVHGRDELDLRQVRTALIGYDAAAADAIRTHLYAYAPVRPFQTDFADLGNAIKNDPVLLIPLLRELLDAGVQPLVIGVPDDFFVAQFRAHEQTQPTTNVALIADRIALSTEETDAPLNQIWLNERLLNLAILGYQSHLSPADLVQLCYDRHFDLLRLGDLQADIAQAEPLLRDADLLNFQLPTVRAADAPARALPSPAGISHDLAAQLMRFAGMSDKLRSVSISGYRHDLDATGQTAAALAQYIWYYLQGSSDRKHDFPVSNDHMTEYIVTTPESYEIHFWKSDRSGRWWFAVPEKDADRSHGRNNLVPCTPDDYQIAAAGELPERWLRVMRRFG